MSHDYHMKPMPQGSGHVTLRAYVIGFVASIVLTLSAYGLVVAHVNSHHWWPSDQVVIPTIIGLALVQFVVQLIFFLHLGTESKPRWKLLVFGFMVLVVSILVFGSLWIMNNLNYHMTGNSANTFIIHDEGIHK